MKRGKFLRSIFGAAAAMIAGPPVVGALVVEKTANKKFIDALQPLRPEDCLLNLKGLDTVIVACEPSTRVGDIVAIKGHTTSHALGCVVTTFYGEATVRALTLNHLFSYDADRIMFHMGNTLKNGQPGM